MFTGIIEALGQVRGIEKKGSNISFWLEVPFFNEVSLGQSIAHDGVCLTVCKIKSGLYSVEAVAETLNKTNLGTWQEGSSLNLERCMRAESRVDGHFVQGHVDTTGQVLEIEVLPGSWNYKFSYDSSFADLLIDKGSIAVNGISLTVVKAERTWFSVTIIPYTFTHTNFQFLNEGAKVNLEFDCLGKYVTRYLQNLKLK